MAIKTETIEYWDGEVKLCGFLAWDDAWQDKRPAVLVFHAWGGRDEFACNKAEELAKLGYVGFAIDMYGNAKLGQTKDENAQLMSPFMADRALLQQRALVALTTVRQQPQVEAEHIAAMGFCFGGLCVLDLARSGADVAGVVSFHGLFKPRDIKTAKIQAKVLMLHGNDDPMVSSEEVLAIQEELTEADCDWQLHSYGNTVHAFTNPVANDPGFGTVYQPLAAQRAWQSLVNFLDEIFA